MMKNVCFLSGYFNNDTLESKSQGGAEYQNQILKNELEKRENNIYFIAIGDKNQVSRDGKTIVIYLKKKIKSRRFGNNFFLYTCQVLLILKRINPDIIYQRGSIAWTGIGAWYAKRYHKKFIWAIASEEDVSPFKYEKFSSLLFNWIDFIFARYGKKNSFAIFAQADYQQKLLFKNYQVKVNEVIKNYHPLPIEVIKKSSVKIKIIWIANFSANKQPELFIKIAESLKFKNNLEFVMIGRPYNESKQEIIEKKINNLNNIIYLGMLKQEEVNREIADSHILINTSTIEGFSNVFIQAMLRGTVVVSLNSNPDDVLNKYNCGYCANGEFLSLISYIIELSENKNKLTEMGDNAMKYAMKNHSIESQIDKITKYF